MREVVGLLYFCMRDCTSARIGQQTPDRLMLQFLLAACIVKLCGSGQGNSFAIGMVGERDVVTHI